MEYLVKSSIVYEKWMFWGTFLYNNGKETFLKLVIFVVIICRLKFFSNIGIISLLLVHLSFSVWLFSDKKREKSAKKRQILSKDFVK